MRLVSTPVSGTQSAVFPLPGTFPWAHSGRGKPRRGMMRRAVFSDLQRKGLERRFQIQKYISKPDRKKLAEKLGLKDSQGTTMERFGGRRGRGRRPRTGACMGVKESISERCHRSYEGLNIPPFNLCCRV
ncbi:hypothetical protein Trydic_g21747 [Trypoxylus dichotomus]